jgi:hypothetical protein
MIRRDSTAPSGNDDPGGVVLFCRMAAAGMDGGVYEKMIREMRMRKEM